MKCPPCEGLVTEITAGILKGCPFFYVLVCAGKNHLIDCK